MHSSLGDALGPVLRRLGSLSDYRASVVQRMRTFSRAQHVVSTIIGWCSRYSSVGGVFGVKQGEFFAEQALRPAHESYSHTDTLPRSSGVAVVERVFPVLFIVGLAPACWRNVILAGRGRKSSATFGTPAIVSLGELAAIDHKYRTGYVGRFV
jgi:hypothetical protein